MYLYGIALIISAMLVSPALTRDEKTHTKLAEEYLQISEYRKQMDVSNEQSAELYIKTYPDFKEHKDAIKRAYRRVFSYEKIKPEMVKMLVNIFTEDELVELNKFMKSPVGKKFIAKSPEVMKAYAGLYSKLAGEQGQVFQEVLNEEINK